MAVNKVIFGDTTLVDMTDATAIASDLVKGKTAYAADGTKLNGTLSTVTGYCCIATKSGHPIERKTGGLLMVEQEVCLFMN